MEADFGDDPHDPPYLKELEHYTQRQPPEHYVMGSHDELLESNRPPQDEPGFGKALLRFKERANRGERGVPKGGKRTARRKGTTKKQKSKKNKRQSRRILRRASSRKGRK